MQYAIFTLPLYVHTFFFPQIVLVMWLFDSASRQLSVNQEGRIGAEVLKLTHKLGRSGANTGLLKVLAERILNISWHSSFQKAFS